MRVFLKARSHIVAGDEALTCNTREKIFFTILDVIIATSYRVSKVNRFASESIDRRSSYYGIHSEIHCKRQRSFDSRFARTFEDSAGASMIREK